MESFEPMVCANPSCSASLVNCPVAGECPECGHRYNKKTQMGTATVTCANSKCGYNLSSLPKWGQCPECGRNYNRITGENVKLPLNAQQKQHLIFWRCIGIGSAILAVFLLMCTGLLSVMGAWENAKGMVSCSLFSFVFFGMLAVYSKLNEKLE